MFYVYLTTKASEGGMGGEGAQRAASFNNAQQKRVIGRANAKM